MQFLHGLGAFRQPPASRSRHPEAASEHPIAASGHPRAFRRHPSNVAENVTKIGVPEKCAPRPRREAYFFKNHAVTTCASTTFQMEVMRKSQREGEKVAAAAARAQISICAKNE